MQAGDQELLLRFYRLISELEYARAAYDSKTADDKRFAAKTSLVACIQFVLRSVPNGIQLVMPLRELLDQLDDLDRGLQLPLLTQVKKAGGRKISRGVETFRATAAVLMEMGIWKNQERSLAAELAAQELNQRGYRDEQGKPITAQRLEDWRDRVKEGGVSLGAKRFKSLCEVLKSYDHQTARNRVFESLSLLPDIWIPDDPIVHSEST